MKNEHSYNAALEWIHGLSRFGSKPGLERISAMLELVGNPHREVRFVHIAGTNGKGSTAAILASVISAAGYQVGLYTSPYLLSFTNRMSVNGHDIDHEELAGLVNQVKPLVEKISSDQRFGQPTEFEVVTVLALIYFARRNVDLVVLEVGLGGRLDATNIVTPLLSVITNVSLEHTDVLGDTVEAIAAEKAGIIKKNVPVLTAVEDQKAFEVVKSRASQLKAPFYRSCPLTLNYDKETACPTFIRQAVTEEGQIFNYHGFSNTLENLFIPLRGIYQLTNATTALAAAELLVDSGFTVDEEAICRGLSTVNWPARLELMKNKPKVVMDGAHNPAAVKNLAAALPEYFRYRQLIMVFGIMADKDGQAMLESILPMCDQVIFTRAAIPRAADPRQIADLALKELGYSKQQIQVIEDVGVALKKGMDLASPEDLVLVTGSFYTVSDARAYWKQVLM